MKTPILVKLGGSALKDSELVHSICQDLAQLHSVGIPFVIVHGGGPSINEELTRRGITWEFYQGQRVTTPEMMDVIEMVLCGKVNRQLVRSLNQCGVKAVGLSGTDARLLFCTRAEERLGNVGRVQAVDTRLLTLYLQTQQKAGSGFVPIIAPIGVDSEGNALNVNADWAASCIAQALNVKKMVYLTDQDGVLGADGKVIPKVDLEDLEELVVQGVVSGGMLAKVNTIMDGLNHKIREIQILNAKRPHSLVQSVLQKQSIGTLCRQRLFEVTQQRLAYA